MAPTSTCPSCGRGSQGTCSVCSNQGAGHGAPSKPGGGTKGK